MAYSLRVSEQAELQIDVLLRYLLLNLSNPSAATRFLDLLESVYDRLEDAPEQFPLCNDIYLEAKGYRKALLSGMDYVVIFSVRGDIVRIHGVYHELEDYASTIESGE